MKRSRNPRAAAAPARIGKAELAYYSGSSAGEPAIDKSNTGLTATTNRAGGASGHRLPEG